MPHMSMSMSGHLAIMAMARAYEYDATHTTHTKHMYNVHMRYI
jgi:hypothetical protein